ncbi:MAG: hypothetical protein ABI645_01525 [Pseudomonadota bacterium]
MDRPLCTVDPDRAERFHPVIRSYWPTARAFRSDTFGRRSPGCVAGALIAWLVASATVWVFPSSLVVFVAAALSGVLQNRATGHLLAIARSSGIRAVDGFAAGESVILGCNKDMAEYALGP